MNLKRIAIGCDHGGFLLKRVVLRHLKKKGFNVEDFGTFSQESVDYPDIAYKLARAISRHPKWRGMLICKTGIGNSIVANKVRGVRAALCYNVKASKLSRQHNDSNILVLGALFVNKVRAKEIVDVWLTTPFEKGRHSRRVKKIERIERL